MWVVWVYVCGKGGGGRGQRWGMAQGGSVLCASDQCHAPHSFVSHCGGGAVDQLVQVSDDSSVGGRHSLRHLSASSAA